MNKQLAHWPLLSAIVLLCLGALPAHAQDTADSEMMMMNPGSTPFHGDFVQRKNPRAHASIDHITPRHFSHSSQVICAG